MAELRGSWVLVSLSMDRPMFTAPLEETLLAAELVTKSGVEVFVNPLVAVAEMNVVAKLSVLMVTMLSLVDEKIVETAVETLLAAELVTKSGVEVAVAERGPTVAEVNVVAELSVMVTMLSLVDEKIVVTGAETCGGMGMARLLEGNVPSMLNPELEV